MDVGVPELLIILVVVLVIFGGAKLPQLARSLGQAQHEFKKGASGHRDGDAEKTPAKDRRARSRPRRSGRRSPRRIRRSSRPGPTRPRTSSGDLDRRRRELRVVEPRVRAVGREQLFV